MQRNTREIALANARTAKTSVTAAPVVASSIASGQGADGSRPVSQVRPPRAAPQTVNGDSRVQRALCFLGSECFVRKKYVAKSSCYFRFSSPPR